MSASVLDLPSEALAFVRETPKRWWFLWLAFMAAGLAAGAFVAALTEIVIAPAIRRNGLYLHDQLDTTRWDPVTMTFVLLAYAIPLTAAAGGPLFAAAWARGSIAFATLPKLLVLLLPEVAAWFVIGDCLFRTPAYTDVPLLRVVPAIAWLGLSTVFLPLAPAVLFLEGPPGFRSVLRRARELGDGNRLLASVTKLAPLVLGGGAIFQLLNRAALGEIAHVEGARGLATFLAVLALVFAPILSGILKVAAYRLLAGGDRA